MRTPSGVECQYFYGNYFRGRSQEECRLIGGVAPPNHWTPDLCKTCPVPGVLRANACPNMQITAKVNRSFLGLKRRVALKAFCTHSKTDVKEPEIGCGQCHTIPTVFKEKFK